VRGGKRDGAVEQHDRAVTPLRAGLPPKLNAFSMCWVSRG